MKKIMVWAFVLGLVMNLNAQNEMKTIKLNEPELSKGETVMQAFKKRKSTREFSDKKLSMQELSNLLWAANGINRPETGMRTAPSAMNKQDVDIYVCLEEGNYFYNVKEHSLVPVSKGDIRTDVRGAMAPAMLVLVTHTNESWAAMDAGIVSQNISLFCAGMNLATVPRGSGMDKETFRKALNLKEPHTLMLNHPVGHFK